MRTRYVSLTIDENRLVLESKEHMRTRQVGVRYGDVAFAMGPAGQSGTPRKSRACDNATDATERR
jgi:hypothetical protein